MNGGVLWRRPRPGRGCSAIDRIIALTNICHWNTSWATLIHSTTSHFAYNMFILITYFLLFHPLSVVVPWISQRPSALSTSFCSLKALLLSQRPSALSKPFCSLNALLLSQRPSALSKPFCSLKALLLSQRSSALSTPFCSPTLQRTKKLCLTVGEISAIFQTRHTQSVLSHVDLANHNECLETGDTRSEAKYDDISGEM
jgi:hypothetical protein